MFSKILSVISFLALSFTASAGLINTADDSFIDETSKLEWMDFGINNTDTYDYVAGQLGVGQKYDGWRLATKDEVYNMYANTFLVLDADVVSPLDNIGRSTVVDGKNGTDSVLDSIYEIMGYNTIRQQGSPFELRWATGLFQGGNGLSLFKTYDVVGSFEKIFTSDTVNYYNHSNFDSYGDDTNLVYSTMLVKNDTLGNITTVPEPSTMAIFALGMIGLASRKFNKQP